MHLTSLQVLTVVVFIQGITGGPILDARQETNNEGVSVRQLNYICRQLMRNSIQKCYVDEKEARSGPGLCAPFGADAPYFCSIQFPVGAKTYTFKYMYLLYFISALRRGTRATIRTGITFVSENLFGLNRCPCTNSLTEKIAYFEC